MDRHKVHLTWGYVHRQHNPLNNKIKVTFFHCSIPWGNREAADYNSTISLNSALEGVGCTAPLPWRLIPTKEPRYPMYRRLGEPQAYLHRSNQRVAAPIKLSRPLVIYLSVTIIFRRSVVGEKKEDILCKYAFLLRFMVFETKTANIPEMLSYEYI